MTIDTKDEQKAWQKVINILSYRAYFSAELQRKLITAGFSKEVIEAVIFRCQQAGYVNDRDHAERMIAMWTKKGYGPLRIRLELQKRGVKEVIPLENNASYIHLYLAKHLPKEPTEQQKAKVIRALVRRGFSLEVIFIALQECLS